MEDQDLILNEEGTWEIVPTPDFVKSTAGKIPIRKTVTRNGKTFSQTFWVKPKDYKSFAGAREAAQFLTDAAEAQNYFSKVVADLAQYNSGLATSIFYKMKQTDKKVIKLADRMVEVSEWTGRRETNLSTFLAYLKNEMVGKRAFSWDDLRKAYADASYKIKSSGIKVITSRGKEEVQKYSVQSKYTPVAWMDKVKEVSKAISDNIKAATGRLGEVLGKTYLQEAASRTKETAAAIPKTNIKAVKVKSNPKEVKHVILRPKTR